MKIVFTILISIVTFFVFTIQPKSLFAQELTPATDSVVNVYFFWDKNCLHCQNENTFLKKLSEETKGIQVHSFEISDQGNSQLLGQILNEYELDLNTVPITFIGTEYLVGFESDETTGREIEELIVALKGIGDPDEIGMFIFDSQNPQNVQNKLQSTADLNTRSVSRHPIDKILDKFKADIILGGILFVIIVGFIISKLKHH